MDSQLITIEPHNNIYAKVNRNDDLYNLLDEYYTIHIKEFDAKENRSVKNPVKIIKADDDYIYLPISLLNNTIDFLQSKNMLVMNNIDEGDKTPNFKVDDSWYEFFSGRNGQTDMFNDIIEHTRGVVQLPTGFGKSVFIISIAESLVDDGNILIVVPFNSIKEELILRFSKRNIKISPGFDINNRINIIHAPGYCNSNHYDDPKCKEWMSKVVMVEIDECENINDSLMKLLDEQVNKYKYIYGYSGSSDKISGIELLANEKTLFKFNESTYRVLVYVGQSLIYEKPQKLIDFHILNSTFYAKKLPFRNTPMEFRLAIKNVVTHSNFKRCLKFILHHKRKILFIPVNEIKIGNSIYDICKNLGFNPVLWSSGNIVSDLGFKSYSDIKKHCESDENKVDVLIATKLAFLGVDINTISDCLLITGTNYSMIVQPIGRAMRYDKPSVWLLEETISSKNQIYRNCHFKRAGIIRKTYKYNEFIHSYNEIEEFDNSIVNKENK